MKMRLGLVALPLMLAACAPGGGLDLPWGKKPVEQAAPAQPAEPKQPSIPEPTGASPLDQPLEVAGSQTLRATANAKTNAIRDLAAEGAGWSATVHGNNIRFAGGAIKGTTISVKRISYARGLEYVGTLNDRPFTLNISAQDCSGKPLTATVRAGGQRYTGCATPITAEQAAAAVPPPPKVVPKKAAPKKATTTPAATEKKAATTPAAPATPATPAPAPAAPAAPATPAPQVVLPPLVLPSAPPGGMSDNP